MTVLMTTLVTGATGFLGSHVARCLAARGDSLRLLVRPESNCRALEGISAERVIGDLRDPESLPRAVNGVDQVFHVAADYRLWASDPAEIYRSNVNGTRHLLEAACRSGVRRFVYTSTVATIAVHRPGPLPSESTIASLPEMIGHYKRSKFLAEQEVLRFCESGFPVVIVNPTTPVGPGDWKPTPSGRIIVDFLNGRMPAYVDTGLNLAPVEDVAYGHLLAAEHGVPGQRYILGGRNMTLKEILTVLAGISGRPAPRICVPHAVAYAAAYVDSAVSRILRREPRIPVEGVRMARHKMFVQTGKSTRDLGYRPGAVEAALERAVRWYQENGYAPAGPRKSLATAAA
jgi:dihydroflavonol-4-reductase